MEGGIPVGEVFDEVVHKYECLMRRCVPFYEEMLEVISTPRDSPEFICDMGCGTGSVTEKLLSHYPEAQYMLIDASIEMLQIARMRLAGHDNIQFMHQYFEKAELPIEKIDLVVACMSFHHLQGGGKSGMYKKLAGAMTEGGEFRCADLMINREDKFIHDQFLEEWKKHNSGRGSDAEEWAWLMDHYFTYDFPEPPDRHQQWLEEAQLVDFELIMQRGPWICWRVRKISHS